MKPGIAAVYVSVAFDSGTGGVTSKVIGRCDGRCHCASGAIVSAGASGRTT